MRNISYEDVELQGTITQRNKTILKTDKLLGQKEILKKARRRITRAQMSIALICAKLDINDHALSDSNYFSVM